MKSIKQNFDFKFNETEKGLFDCEKKLKNHLQFHGRIIIV